MANENSIYVGTSFLKDQTKPEFLDLKYGNRHGLITGATGTGKTVSLQVLAEGLSMRGVPVFAADIKGDLSGISQIGVAKDFIDARVKKIGETDFAFHDNPVMYWDVLGEQGHPIRATIESMGALLLSNLLELNICFRVAADEKLPLVDLKDLRAILANVSDRAAELSAKYGNVAKASIGTVQRRLLVLEEQGAANFFGEPMLDINNLMRTTPDGRGFINVLAADKLMHSPRLYSVFLFWLMSELFTQLPELGDPDKPRLVFFFDEAHLLFDQAPKALLDKVEQVTRLIRSKGVGIYYITQNPLDVPDAVAGQLGNRIQHALRAFTPREQKAVRAAATTFRQNPDIDTEKVIMELGVGEALVSFLEGKGTPEMVARTFMRPPSGRIGAITPEERRAVIQKSPVFGMYETAVDRESASDILARRGTPGQAAPAGADQPQEHSGGGWFGIPGLGGGNSQPPPPAPGSKPGRAPAQPRGQTAGQAFTKSLLRSLGTVAGQVIGSMLRGRR